MRVVKWTAATAFFIAVAALLIHFFVSTKSTSFFLQHESETTSFTATTPIALPPAAIVPVELPPRATTISADTLLLPIFMYHHVGNLPQNADPIRADLTVSPVDFEAQVSWLASQGYHSITLEDVYRYRQGTFVMPSRPIIFTFDDGYDDVFQNAVPILEKYGFVGSFAIITQFPGNVNGTNTYATWQMIAAAQAQGMEIVSHTQNHFDGTSPQFSADYIEKNLTGSVDDLRMHLGTTTNVLVYPYGHYDAQYLAATTHDGFVIGVTTREGAFANLNDLLELPRIRVHGHEDLTSYIKIFNELTPREVPLSRAITQGE